MRGGGEMGLITVSGTSYNSVYINNHAKIKI
jgi:hypothetical protein